MNPLNVTSQSFTNLMEHDLKEFPNFRQNLCKYLLQITLDDSQSSQCANRQNLSTYCNLEEHLLKDMGKKQSDEKCEIVLFINIDQLVKFFVEECLQNFLHITPGFASYYLHLLIRDSQDGLEQVIPSQGIRVYEIEKFLLTALIKYKNASDATVSSMKISYYFKSSQELQLNFVKEKYEQYFNKKMEQLIKNILQYPETSSTEQIEEMFSKMQVFIITKYQIGHPENHTLLKQCRQSLNSILGKGDIQRYVLKKRNHRLEYLQKLAATAAGIIIFNNQGSKDDIENVRNIFADLKMATRNTEESLQRSFDRIQLLKQKALNVMLEIVEINVQQEYISCLRPLNEVRELNQFVALFEVYRKSLEKTKAVFEKTQYLIEVDHKKFDCVVEKINEILKYRSAIETEKIFPHFVYLSELWTSLLLYLNHLVEINQIKDHIDDLLNGELENKFNDILKNLSDKNKYLRQSLEYSFQEVISSTTKRELELNMLNIKPFVKDYCALTMAFTGGFLVPSQLEKKLCENVNFRFGFSNMEYAKFAEYNFENFIQVFRATILNCTDLIVLFELDDEVMQRDFDLIQQTKPKTKSLDTQTEMISNNRNQTDETWNIWDFHRQTIKLADMRKSQSHWTQTNLSCGLRNAQIQCALTANNGTQN